MNTIICHMTSIDNLEMIISQDGLLCKNELSQHELSFSDIANKNVQDKRARTFVPLPPGGNLHDYVPFYFWGQTPMLLVNKHRQNDIIFFVIQTKGVAQASLPFAFTDRHAIVKYAKFYNNLEDLAKLDWAAIKSQYWQSTQENPEQSEKKQAEFLIYKKLPWELINGIVVINEDMVNRVTAKLNPQKYKPIVKVKQEWYYP